MSSLAWQLAGSRAGVHARDLYLTWQNFLALLFVIKEIKSYHAIWYLKSSCCMSVRIAGSCVVTVTSDPLEATPKIGKIVRGFPHLRSSLVHMHPGKDISTRVEPGIPGFPLLDPPKIPVCSDISSQEGSQSSHYLLLKTSLSPGLNTDSCRPCVPNRANVDFQKTPPSCSFLVCSRIKCSQSREG